MKFNLYILAMLLGHASMILCSQSSKSNADTFEGISFEELFCHFNKSKKDVPQHTDIKRHVEFREQNKQNAATDFRNFARDSISSLTFAFKGVTITDKPSALSEFQKLAFRSQQEASEMFEYEEEYPLFYQTIFQDGYFKEVRGLKKQYNLLLKALNPQNDPTGSRRGKILDILKKLQERCDQLSNEVPKAQKKFPL